ncbi:SDR family oxidoreductase [Adhaeribacter aquaticus]|uniref:SDR family oxidoreductase n=1 Tax=Adhaeribacter aquaticus TaxID=299567 RepID=UPI000409AEFD|nr:SDR family oxidoreductase [Adhaeribacter aquaticus]
MKDTILVTGATGTVGSEVVKALSGEDVNVRAGVHSLIKGDPLKAFPNVDLVHLEFENPELLKVAFTGVTKVFLVTPFTQNQQEVAKKMIDAAREAGVKQIVRLSAAGADAQPGIQLGRWHREVEEYLEQAGISFTILRPASFMQNFVHYSGETIRNNNGVYMPLGLGKVGYIDVRDIAAVARIVLTQSGHENKIYELTGPAAISVNDVAHAFTQATDRLITYVDVPEEAAAVAMRQHHMPEWMVQAMLELYSICKAGYAAQVTNTVAEITGTPPRSIDEFAQDYAEALIPK